MFSLALTPPDRRNGPSPDYFWKRLKRGVALRAERDGGRGTGFSQQTQKGCYLGKIDKTPTERRGRQFWEQRVLHARVTCDGKGTFRACYEAFAPENAFLPNKSLATPGPGSTPFDERATVFGSYKAFLHPSFVASTNASLEISLQLPSQQPNDPTTLTPPQHTAAASSCTRSSAARYPSTTSRFRIYSRR